MEMPLADPWRQDRWAGRIVLVRIAAWLATPRAESTYRLLACTTGLLAPEGRRSLASLLAPSGGLGHLPTILAGLSNALDRTVSGRLLRHVDDIQAGQKARGGSAGEL